MTENPSVIQELKDNLIFHTKKGIDFMMAASLVWFLIAIVWTFPFSAYDRSVLTFIVGALLMPLALLFSKLLQTRWTLKDNPLQPLGLWLNLAQLIYFPVLIWMLLKAPDHFVMTYVIITGAHLFPYGWLYREVGYLVASILSSLGALLLDLWLPLDRIYIIPLFMSLVLFGLVIRLWSKVKSNKDAQLSD